MRIAVVLLVLVSCGACSTLRNDRVVAAATPEDRALLLDRVKSLAGTWEGKAPDGAAVTTVFQVVSNGTAVRETMFPGTPHEMTNMYTMDGRELLMTHYCALGNQPHMRASASNGDRIVFKSAGVSNLTAADQMYMGELTIEFIDNDRIRQHWQSLVNGQPGDHNMTIEMTRRQ